jgi:DNA-directed RNA polymerase specialized sigma24 family protein
MKIPKGMSEKDVIDTIDRVSNRLAYKYKFGYHGIEDIKQQAALHAIKAMDKYDDSRPLENFLWTHIRNRLFNDKRNNYQRPDKPCLNCPLKAYDPHYLKSNSQCTKFSDKTECDLYVRWMRRNEPKKNIMKPIDLEQVQDERESNMKTEDCIESISNKEIWDLIDTHLDVSLRSDYIKLRNGIKISKSRRKKIESIILEIVQNHE